MLAPKFGGIIPTTGSPSLAFDGQPNDYQMLTGQLSGDVRFNQDGTAPYADTALILLTLDVRSNLPNDSTFVNLDFWNAKEIDISTFTSFDCWEQVQLTAIDPNLTAASMGTPNGLVVSGQAFDVKTGAFRSLVVIIQTAEGPMGGTAASSRSYTVKPSNDSIPVPSYFVFD